MKHSPMCPPGADWHPDEAFGRNKRRKDGMTLYCRACTSAYHKKWRQEHQDRIRHYTRTATMQRRFDSGRPANRPINRTGFKGVVDASFESKRDYPGERVPSYQARITVDGKRRSLGYFTSATQAARAYDEEVDRLGLHREMNF